MEDRNPVVRRGSGRPHRNEEAVCGEVRMRRVFNETFAVGIMVLMCGCRVPTEPTDPARGAGTNISNLGGGSSRPVIAVSPNGDVSVVWTQQVGEDHPSEEIFYTMKSEDGSWSTPVNLSNNDMDSRFPSIDVDEEGKIHVAWQDLSGSGHGWELFYSVKPVEGGWSLPETLTYGGMSAVPDMVVDQEGSAHLIWKEYLVGVSELFYRRRDPDGSWSQPVSLSGSSDWLLWGDADIDVDPWGSVHVVWDGWKEPFRSEIFYTKKPMGGVWTVSENISRTEEGYSYRPSVVTGNEGDLHIVWSDDTEIVDGFHQLEIYYATKPEEGDWADPIDISVLRRHSNLPCLTHDLQGNLHLVWHAAKFEPRIYYAIKRRGEDWSDPIFLCRPDVGDVHPALAADPEGKVHVVWQDGHPTGNISYFGFKP